jgi:hypothetical protein
MEVEKYIYEVASDSEFKNIIYSGETVDIRTEIKNPKLGEFYFRVRGIDKQGYIIPELYFNKFYVIDQALPAPKLKSPTIHRGNDKKETSTNKNIIKDISWIEKVWQFFLPSAEAARRGKKSYRTLAAEKSINETYFAEFLWEPVEGADSYIIEISQQPDFQNLIIDQTVSRPRFKWNDFPKGKYYWRVAGKAGFALGLYSDVAYADLTVIPDGPITAQAPPKNIAPVPTPNPSPALVVGGAAKMNSAANKNLTQEAKPTPTPPLKITTTPFTQWDYQVDLGGYGIYQHYKGEDYLAKDVGFSPGVVRFSSLAHPKQESWRWEVELERLMTRAKDPKVLPYQTAQVAYAGRFTLINELPYVDTWSWGATIHNEQVVYQREDLEKLRVLNQPWIGLHLSQRNYTRSDDTEMRWGIFGGYGVYGEMKVIQSWTLSESGSMAWVMTVDGSLTAGYSLFKAWWIQGQGALFFGVRW